MNHRSDIDRVLQTWMADGPAVIPDRVVDVVAARIGVQRQRRSWPFPGRTTVNQTQIKLVAGLAAAVVLAVAGYSLLPGLSSNAGGSTPPPTEAPSTAPTATAKPGPTPTKISYQQFGTSGSLTVRLDLPVGWGEFSPGWLFGPERPEGVGVVISEIQGLYSDPCQWDVAGTGDEDQPGDMAVGADALELTTALHDNPAYTSVGAPAPITIGSYAGYSLEIQLPADLEFVGPTCDVVTGDQDGSYVVLGALHFYPQGPGNHWQTSVVDVGDVQLAIVLSYFDGTPAADLAAARSLIDSIEITR